MEIIWKWPNHKRLYPKQVTSIVEYLNLPCNKSSHAINNEQLHMVLKEWDLELLQTGMKIILTSWHSLTFIFNHLVVSQKSTAHFVNACGQPSSLYTRINVLTRDNKKQILFRIIPLSELRKWCRPHNKNPTSHLPCK